MLTHILNSNIQTFFETIPNAVEIHYIDVEGSLVLLSAAAAIFLAQRPLHGQTDFF